VRVDAIAGLPLDLLDHGAEAGVLDLGRAAAARADDMMMVGGLATDVRVLTGRQVEALDGPELD
jgi:hypothetical protein